MDFVRVTENTENLLGNPGTFWVKFRKSTLEHYHCVTCSQFPKVCSKSSNNTVLFADSLDYDNFEPEV